MRLLDPAAIEAELRTSVMRSSEGAARASLFNMILFDHVAHPSALAAATEALLGKRPARIIHVHSGCEQPTEVHVSARCYPDRRNRGVCFEEIHIMNGPDGKGLDPGSWSALLLRELPVFAVLADPTVPITARLRDLAGMADKAFFDTGDSAAEATLQVLADLGRLVAETAAAEPRLWLADFAWLRGLSQRRALARAFEGRVAEGLWQNIRSLDVRGGRAIEAMLLALWLGSRLEWQPRHAARAELVFEDRRGVAVRCTHAPSAAGWEASLALDGGEAIELAVEGATLRVRRIDGAVTESPLGPQETGALLLREVDTLRGDPLYLAALGWAARFADFS